MTFMRHGAAFVRTLLLLAAIFTTAGGSVAAQRASPRFEDYPAAEAYNGKTAPLVLTRGDRAYRTRLREAAKERPNFAGRYIVTTWGCGTTCLMGAAIDAKTGRIYWLPNTVCCWTDTGDDFKPIEFRPDSRLIVFRGLRNERESDAGAHYYKFERGRFVFVRSVKQCGR